jgi:2-aminoadipate transaminase
MPYARGTKLAMSPHVESGIKLTEPARRRPYLSLAGDHPAPELCRGALRHAAATVTTRPRRDAGTQGNEVLREWIARRLYYRGAAVGPEDIILTTGAPQALAIAASVVLAPGDRVEVDAETSADALEVFRSRLAEPVAIDARRLRPEPGMFAEDSPACRYVMPGVSTPRGTGLSADRRAELLATYAPLIVDESAAELRFDGDTERPLLADARDRTWHIGSFSQTLLPTARVGFLIPPRRCLSSALRAKRSRFDTDDEATTQGVVAQLLAHDNFDFRLANARRVYRKRADRFMRALRRHFPSWRFHEPEGGFSLFVETDEEGDDAQLCAIAARYGVPFDPGHAFRVTETATVSMRLSFGTLSALAAEQAVVTLQRAWKVWASERRAVERAHSAA